MCKRSHEHANQLESRSATERASPSAASRAAAVHTAVVIFTWPGGTSSQHHRDSCGQISRLRSFHLRAALGIQRQILALRNLQAVDGGLNLLLNSIRRHNFMKGNTQLPVAGEPARRPDL